MSCWPDLSTSNRTVIGSNRNLQISDKHSGKKGKTVVKTNQVWIYDIKFNETEAFEQIEIDPPGLLINSILSLHMSFAKQLSLELF